VIPELTVNSVLTHSYASTWNSISKLYVGLRADQKTTEGLCNDICTSVYDSIVPPIKLTQIQYMAKSVSSSTNPWSMPRPVHTNKPVHPVVLACKNSQHKQILSNDLKMVSSEGRCLFYTTSGDLMLIWRLYVGHGLRWLCCRIPKIAGVQIANTLRPVVIPWLIWFSLPINSIDSEDPSLRGSNFEALCSKR